MLTTLVYVVAAVLTVQTVDSPGEQYLQRMTAAMQADAGDAEIDAVLALFTPDAVYEHPAFGMRIAGVETMRAGRRKQLGLTRNARVSLRGRTGLKAVEAIAVELSFEARDGDGWRPVRRNQLLVFEYKDTRISRIIEYWDQ